ncbi:hypothetical protein L798_07042 [Zootermopsis nevadensis]|uniref:Uncharacterized protein n=1 Tax=Zootermopsis nevadensis TaxID=136037 RepID=A0A067RG15_ZOONE|nr:hypothetical protein L798_07042 [Zootermopsis nevadensis]
MLYTNNIINSKIRENTAIQVATTKKTCWLYKCIRKRKKNISSFLNNSDIFRMLLQRIRQTAHNRIIRSENNCNIRGIFLTKCNTDTIQWQLNNDHGQRNRSTPCYRLFQRQS